MWGTWWVWDARLTSVLILFFLYLGFIALKDAFDDPARGEKAAAILAVVGSINVPIIKFSVEWWNTLHQPPSLGVTKVAIHSSILLPLMLMAAGFGFYFGAVLLIRMKSLMLARRARGMAMARAAGQPGASRKRRGSEMAEFFAMGGYAAFNSGRSTGWRLLLLGGFLFTSLRGLRTMEREVEALEKASPRRGPRGSGGAS